MNQKLTQRWANRKALEAMAAFCEAHDLEELFGEEAFMEHCESQAALEILDKAQRNAVKRIRSLIGE